MTSAIGTLSPVHDVLRIYGRPSARQGRIGDPAAGNTVGAVTFRDAATIIHGAYLGAESIADQLTAVAALVGRAQNEALVLGTEDSLTNLQARTRRAVAGIDETVGAVGWRGYNLLSGANGALRVESRSLGGTVTVPAQPMDSTALGLRNLDFTSETALTSAAAAVALARGRVARSVVVLRNLDSALPDLASFVQALAGATENIQAKSLPRGAIINLSA